jgi:hypothetical protein
MKTGIRNALITTMFYGAVCIGHSQGTFRNLAFENPIPPLVRDASFMVPSSNAIPGWTAYISGVPQASIVYNTRPLDAAAVTLQGTNSDSLAPIQGNYTVALFGASPFAPQQSAAIGQTGQIPADSESLLFYASSLSLQVTFGGQPIPLVQVGSGTGYIILGGDISSFAGQTAELLFTSPPQTASLLDRILFSNQPIPEPSVLALGAVGIVLFPLFRHKGTRRG